MPSISLGGRSYFYEEAGSGTPLLLLHGFPFDSRSYAPQLAKPPSGFRLIVPDHRGFGRSEFVPGVATMDDLAEDALALLDALQISAAVVGGVSMGGYVAIALTRLDPGRVSGLLLIDTQSTPDDDAGKQRRETVAQDAEKNGVDGVVKALLPKLVLPTSPALPALEAMMREQNPLAVAAASRGMAARIDGKDILSRYSGPCRIIFGEQDSIMPLEKAKQMQSLIQGSTLHVIPGAAHLPNLEQPELFAEVLAS